MIVRNLFWSLFTLFGHQVLLISLLVKLFLNSLHFARNLFITLFYLNLSLSWIFVRTIRTFWKRSMGMLRCHVFVYILWTPKIIWVNWKYFGRLYFFNILILFWFIYLFFILIWFKLSLTFKVILFDWGNLTHVDFLINWTLTRLTAERKFFVWDRF